MAIASSVEAWLHRTYIAAGGARLRREDHKKARELCGLLVEIERAIGSSRAPLTVVDAAAGKNYVGLMTAELLLLPRAREACIVAIERTGSYARIVAEASHHLPSNLRFEFRQGDVADARLWPQRPDLVVALHACGPASDAVIERAVASRARRLLLVPCCTSKDVQAESLARRFAETLGLPPQAEVRRRFYQSVVDAHRTLRLEAAGYEVDVMAFVPPTVTPHNLLWRARWVGEPERMRTAMKRLARLLHPEHLGYTTNVDEVHER